MEAFETEEHAGYLCELHADYDAGNPFTEWDNASEILSDVRGYDLGEKVPHPESSYSDTPPSAVMARWLTLFGGYAVAIPFHFADYGSNGARVWLHEPDDDPASGWLVMTRETATKEWPGDFAKAEECARSEFAAFAAWLEGYVCGWLVRDPETSDVLDSCWGYYGETDYPMQEAKSAAEWLRKERLVNQEPTDVAELLAVAG